MKSRMVWSVVAFAAGLWTARSEALNVGDPAPAFQALDESGKQWSSSDHVGKSLLAIFFYPAAMTGG